MSHDRLIGGVVVVLLIKIADTLTGYHVGEVQIDKESNQLVFILRSIMSGPKTREYSLESVFSHLRSNTGLSKYFASPYTLKIFLKSADVFAINSRYGFSFDTLSTLDNAIKQLNISARTY